MLYHSTRSHDSAIPSKQAILAGIAPDGGLYVADELGQTTVDVAQVCKQNYRQTAQQILGLLLDDYSTAEIERCVGAAYGTNFDTPAVVPATPLGSDWLLELFHGPTCAFKDVALQMLPQLMQVARTDTSERIMIVTATSGDTGKAALDGFADVPGCGITVFYPAGKVSDIQRLQMVTQTGGNVAVCGVRGNFDDAQRSVKEVFADHALGARLAAGQVRLSSANSINVGRLVPQVVYYFDAYAQLVRAGALKVGDELDFCVPTGNFGDVLAGWYAKRLGLPVHRLIVASNSNDVLCDFIHTGIYDRRRDFIKTISPSMDILVSSNVERLLYYCSGGDSELVRRLMGELAETGCYTLPSELHKRIQADFVCGHASDAETRAAIRNAWEEHQVLLDPHTAVAYHVLRGLSSDGVPRVCLATANPFKFPADVLTALGGTTEEMSDFACMDALAELTGHTPPAALANLRTAPVLHEAVIDVAGVPSFVETAAQEVFV